MIILWAGNAVAYTHEFTRKSRERSLHEPRPDHSMIWATFVILKRRA